MARRAHVHHCRDTITSVVGTGRRREREVEGGKGENRKKSEIVFERTTNMEGENNANVKRNTEVFDDDAEEVKKKPKIDHQDLHGQPSSSTTRGAAMEEDKGEQTRIPRSKTVRRESQSLLRRLA